MARKDGVDKDDDEDDDSGTCGYGSRMGRNRFAAWAKR